MTKQRRQKGKKEGNEGEREDEREERESERKTEKELLVRSVFSNETGARLYFSDVPDGECFVQSRRDIPP